MPNAVSINAARSQKRTNEVYTLKDAYTRQRTEDLVTSRKAENKVRGKIKQ